MRTDNAARTGTEAEASRQHCTQTGRDQLSVISAEKFNPDTSAVTKKTTIARPIAILLVTAALWGLASVIAERNGIHLTLKSASEALRSELECAR